MGVVRNALLDYSGLSVCVFQKFSTHPPGSLREIYEDVFNYKSKQHHGRRSLLGLEKGCWWHLAGQPLSFCDEIGVGLVASGWSQSPEDTHTACS